MIIKKKKYMYYYMRSKRFSRKLSGGRGKYTKFSKYKRVLSNKNNKHNTSGIKQVKLPKNPSFAAKLGAFLLEGVRDEVFFSKKTGFSGKHHQVFGVLPFLHMNIKEKEFKALLDKDVNLLGRVLGGMCNKQNLNKTLKGVNFDCDKQSKSAVVALNMGIMDSINNRYHIRKNGIKKLEQILSIQTWQFNKNYQQISHKSLNWGK